MKSLGLLIAICLYLKADAMEEKTLDEILMEASNDSMSFDLVSSGSSENPTVRIEHDIMMTLDDYMQQEKERMAEEKMGRRKKRKAIRSQQSRWPGKIVPYEIAPNTFSQTERNQINLAIEDWNRETCVVFRERRGESSAVRFENGQGCSSFVGTIGRVQPISLARGCRIRRIVVHEMGHAVGFQHEQSRPDRDGFVRIRTENIPQPVLFNFNKLPTSRVNNFDVPYDYRSVMHYGARDFSTNGQITVQTIDSRFQNIIGRAPGLSYNDIKLANIMYNCAENCPAQSCPGEGFVGKDCSCKCPTNNPNNPVQNCTGTTLVTTTSVSSSTIRTTTPTEGACEDMNRYCDYWAGQGYCSRSRYMMMYCKAACNLCNAQKRCEDMGQSCGLLRDRGFCTLQFVRSYMESNCAATCNFCRAGELLSADGTPLRSKASNLGSTTMLILIPVFIVWSVLL
ncbi:zinc metalloproteinase nas-6-like [Saccostrea echinata]|uniref:zinc metalloproteinase nas-6-like n=1 Tax=Saccostrea echinata TaxID=191078 RepID=UPI002A81322A|nr:zinc metalloproteinase nas-6-like [Saccostrea echinata]